MTDPAALSPRPVRAWPTALLAAVFWSFLFIVSQVDMGMFPRFMSKAMASLAFLLLFLILWLSNGTVRWRVRFLGLGVFVAGTAAAIKVADRSFDPISYLMMAVPYVLTAWAAWLLIARRRGASVEGPGLAVILLATLAVFDLVRWDGTDGRLSSSMSWRWTPTPEQAFVADHPAVAPRSTRPWTLQPGDSPEFRGARRDGIVRGTKVGSAPPALVWKQAVGPGWSSMIVVDGFLVTQEQRGESETVTCYEAETGKEVWSHLESVLFTEGISGAGPRATPTWHGGRIYALGATGRLICLEASTGNPVWTRETSTKTPQWGYSASPLVAEGKVVSFAGGRVQTFDASTGAPGWSREGGKESYTSAEVVTIAGKAQIVMHDNKSLVGLSIADGTLLWERPGVSENAVPMLQPHPVGEGLILAVQGMGVSLVEVKQEGGKWTATEKWVTNRFQPSYNDFVVHEGRVYGLDDGILACIDVRTGERVWKKGRYGHGQVLLLADSGILAVLSETGELALVAAKPEEPGDVERLPVLKGKTWNHPVVVRDRLYVRNGTEMACYRLPPP